MVHSNPITSESLIRIGVTLLNPDPFLEMLLDQIGVDWELHDPKKENEIYTSCVILNRTLTHEETEYWIYRYRSHFETILDTRANLFNFELKRDRFTPPISHQDFLLGDLSDLPFLPISVLKNEKAPLLEQTVYLESDNAYAWCGWFSGFPANETAQSIKSYPVESSDRRSGFGIHSLTKSLDPSESVHDIPYAHYRHLLQKILLILHEKRSLPFVCKSPYPEKSESVFLFRVDSDYSDKEHVQKLFTLLDSYRVRSTWFMHTEAHQDWIQDFERYTEHEFAIHGHRHRRFNEPTELRNNIRKAHSVLRPLFPERTVDGYAEPFGTYHNSLVEVLSEYKSPDSDLLNQAPSPIRFLYSSEFGFDANNLPHWPLQRQGPLQIPIHPICPGSFSRTMADRDQIKTYFENQVYLALQREDPLAFYHHPMQPYDDILDHLFSVVERLTHEGAEIRNMTFSEWAKWWIKRARTSHTVLFKHKTGALHISESISHVRFSDLNLRYRVFMNGNRYIVPPGQYSKHLPKDFKRSHMHSFSDLTLATKADNRSHRQRIDHVRNQLLNHLGRLTQ